MTLAAIEATGPGGEFSRCELPTSGLSAPRTLGRHADLRADWDPAISVVHAEIVAEENGYRITCVRSARNPLFHAGQSYRTLHLSLGEHFAIGQTRFELCQVQPKETIPNPRQTSPAMGAEAGSLAETWTRLARSDDPDVLATRLADAALDLPGCRWATVSIAAASDDPERFSDHNRRILAHRATGVVTTEESVATVVDGSPRWHFEVGGQPAHLASAPTDLARGAEFARVQIDARRRGSTLGRFLSPTVLRQLEHRSIEDVLAVRSCEIVVMFADRVGFTRETQTTVGLDDLLADLSRDLTLITEAVRSRGGVIGDFHGDAVMAFWGWPLPEPDAALHCLSVAKHLAMATGGRFRFGIAGGMAAVGGIGSADQQKVTAIGPPVNLAARLQELARDLDPPLIIDNDTAREALDRTTAPGPSDSRSADVTVAGQLRLIKNPPQPRGLEGTFDLWTLSE